MSFFNQYPYININDLNLDFILNAIKEMKYEVTNFVSINAIKYADPIQWNITSQYEKNTIVIDPVTGTAYISVAPVPAGVALTRTEYWTVVFDLGSFVTRAAQNFTSRWESDTTTTATFSTPAGAWLVWGDVLYKALVNITAGDTYVIDSNIEHFTIEDLYNTYLNTIAAILALVGDLADLTTSDTTSIVNAINSVVTDYIAGDDALDLKIGDLTNLNTFSRNDIVDAINSVFETLDGIVINVKDYGATGDGVADDTAALNAAMVAGEGHIVYVPDGTYLISNPIYIHSYTHVIMSDDATILFDISSTSANGRVIFAEQGATPSAHNGVHDCIFEGGTIDHGFDALYGVDDARGVCMALWHNKNIIIRNVKMCHTYNEHCIELNSSKNVIIENCKFFDCYSYDDTRNSYEAINIDWATSYNPAYIGTYDNTENENVYIDKCTFDNVLNAIGAHISPALIDYSAINRHKNINVNDCVFENIRGIVINARLWTISTVKNCRFADIAISNASIVEAYHSYGVYIEKCSFANCNAANVVIFHIQSYNGNDYVNYFCFMDDCYFVDCVSQNSSINIHNLWRGAITNCKFSSLTSGYNVIAINTCGDIFIKDNILHNCPKAGENFIYVSNSVNYLECLNNTIVANNAAYNWDIGGASGSVIGGRLECLYNSKSAHVDKILSSAMGNNCLVNGKTLLFNGNSNSGTIDLTQSIRYFTAIVIGVTSGGVSNLTYHLVLPWLTRNVFQSGGNDDKICFISETGKNQLTITDDDTLTWDTASGDAIRTIYGIHSL